MGVVKWKLETDGNIRKQIDVANVAGRAYHPHIRDIRQHGDSQPYTPPYVVISPRISNDGLNVGITWLPVGKAQFQMML